MNFKTQITKIHYDKNASGMIFNFLKFCSIFYGIASSTKNLLYDKGILHQKKVEVPVISVGNLTTGGVGKTPVVAELAKYLIQNGEKVAIVSRGYGGKLSNKQINVISDGSNIFYNSLLAGDEPFWLAQNTGAVVITSKNRYKAAKFAIKELGATRIILDDGFQHRKLYRDIDIVLCDSEKVLGNENLLPAGPLREGMEGFKRVHRLLIVSKNIDHSKAEKLARIMGKKLKVNTSVCKIEPDFIYNIKTGEKLAQNTEIAAISAIGQPEQFYKFLTNYNVCITRTFDDHHQYQLSDITDIKLPIVTTEKDAVKLKEFDLDNIYALKLKTTLAISEILNNQQLF